MPIDAGRFEPVRADIYSIVTAYENREPIQTLSLLCRRHIRFPQQIRTGYESQVSHQTQSVGQILIRMRRDPVTETLDPTMEIHHRGSIYGIISPSPIPQRDELEWLCQFRTESAIYS
jgi:hypothetical protein